VPKSRDDGLGGDRVPGPRAVRELLVARRRQVREVFVSQHDSSELLEEIMRLAADAGVRVRLVDAERVRTEARTDSAQSVVARAEPVRAAQLEDIADRPDAFVVALEGVTDPGNLGAVLRTAETAGATGALLPRHRSALLTPAAVKAAAGAVEHLPIVLAGGIAGALEQLDRRGVWRAGLAAEGTTSVFDLELADAPLALVLGAEGDGLSRLSRERCDVLVSIPMRGKLEALNVAAAAAVACFEVARRRSP